MPRLIAPITATASHPSNEIAELPARLTVLDIPDLPASFGVIVDQQYFGHKLCAVERVLRASILRPGVLRIAATHLAAHLGPASAPETGEIRRNCDRPACR